MTFIETLKILWVAQFLMGSAILLVQYKELEKEMEELAPELSPNGVRIFFFLIAVLGGWFLFYDFLKEYRPFWIHRPGAWFWWEVKMPLMDKYNQYKYGRRRKLNRKNRTDYHAQRLRKHRPKQAA